MNLTTDRTHLASFCFLFLQRSAYRSCTISCLFGGRHTATICLLPPCQHIPCMYYQRWLNSGCTRGVIQLEVRGISVGGVFFVFGPVGKDADHHDVLQKAVPDGWMQLDDGEKQMQILLYQRRSEGDGPAFGLQQLPHWKIRRRNQGNLHDTRISTLDYIGHSRISLNQAVGTPPILIIIPVVMHSVARHCTMSKQWSSMYGQRVRTRTRRLSHRRNAWRWPTGLKTKARVHQLR